MRWDNLNDTADDATTARNALFSAESVTTRTFETPEFAGITFHEIRARSIVNRVPGASRMPFEWTVNPYRGCSHACVYCFARKTHSYLDLDTGLGFDSQIVVKVNAPELLRKRLASARWHGEHIAMGTNVDCYQRAEGRYALMPGIITALTEHANPFSILTKGTLILRDLPLLAEAARVTRVGVSVSVGFTDETLWRTVEPGTPAPPGGSTSCGGSASGAWTAASSWPRSSRTWATARSNWRRRCGPSPRRAPPRSRRSCCISDPARASGSCPGSPASTPASSGPTGACTGTGPTRRRGTSAASRARSTNSPAPTAWANGASPRGVRRRAGAADGAAVRRTARRAPCGSAWRLRTPRSTRGGPNRRARPSSAFCEPVAHDPHAPGTGRGGSGERAVVARERATAARERAVAAQGNGPS